MFYGVKQGVLLSALLFCEFITEINSQIISQATRPILTGDPNIVHAEFASFYCSSSGDPVPTITWTLGNEKVLNVKYSPILNNFINSSVTFLALYEDNGKNLSCIVDQTGDSSLYLIDYVTLRISYVSTPAPASPISTVSRSQFMVAPQSQITMNCTIRSAVNITEIYWKKTSNGIFDIHPGTNTSKYIITNDVLSSPKTSFMTVMNISTSDAGGYVCYAVPSRGSPGTSNTVMVYVVTFTVSPTPYNRFVGGSVTLLCNINGISSYSINWYRNGQRLNIAGDSRYVNGNNVTPSLTINTLTTNDAGKYVCQVSSGGDVLNSPEITLNVDVGTGPVVTVSTATYIVNSGDNVTLTCSVPPGTPLSRMYWTKSQTGQEISTSLPGSSGVSTTTLYGVTSSQAGSYVCHAVSSVNLQTGISSPVSLIVIDTGNAVYNKISGDNVTLQCNVNSPSTYSVSWYRNGTLIDTTGNPNKYQGGTISVASLTVKSLTVGDTGTYSCGITSGGITKRSSDIRLNVSPGDAPTVTVPSTPYIEKSGNTVTLPCAIPSSGISNVYWTRTVSGGSTQFIYSTTPGYSGSTVSVPSLTISSASAGNAGSYRCHATSSVNQKTGNSDPIDLVVIGTSSSAYNKNVGETVTLLCNVNPPSSAYTIRWFRNGVEMTDITSNPARYSGGTSSNPSLTIRSLTLNDAGVYTCRVGIGTSFQDSASITLNIQPGDAPSVNVSSSPYIVRSGSSKTMSCVIPSSGISRVYWTRTASGGSTQIIDSTTPGFSGSMISVPSLTIINASAAYAGSYTCHAVSSINGKTGNSNPVSLVVIDTGTSSSTGIVGGSVTLQCNVSPPSSGYTVTWLRNGAQIFVNSNQAKYSGGTSLTPSLTIRSLTLADTGTYTCRVGSGGVSADSSVSLNVQQDITPQVSSSPYIVNSGSNVTLACSVPPGTTLSDVYWTKTQTGEIIRSGNAGYGGITRTDPSLTIYGVTSSKAGSYICHVTSTIDGQTRSSSAVNLIVIDPVTTQYNRNAGDDVMLVCNVNSPTQSYSISWYKDGSYLNIAANRNKYIGGTTSSPSLTIRSLTASDDGVYVCRVTYSDGTYNNSPNINLDVQGASPTILQFSPPSVSVRSGERIQVNASSNGSPTPTYTWRKNGNIVNTGPTFVIQSASVSDSGIYTVTATNNVGVISNSFSVSVQALDITPIVSTTPYIVNSRDSVTLNCSVPAGTTLSDVYWTKTQTGEIIRSGSAGYRGITLNDPSMIIDSVSSSNAGSYICNVVSTDGQRRSSSAVNLIVIDPVTTQYNRNVGGEVTLVCNVNSPTQSYTISWLKDGAFLNTANTNKYEGGTTASPSLKIKSLTASDDGVYVCRVRYSDGTSKDSQNINLDIQTVAPTNVQFSPTSVSVRSGERIEVTASSDGLPTPTYTWRKNGNIVYVGQTFVIPSASVNDDGVYTVTASNSAGQISNSFTVSIQAQAPTVTVQVTQYFVQAGGTVTIQCSSNPSGESSLLEVYWVRTLTNGIQQRLYSYTSSRYTGITKDNPSVTITSVTGSDAGEYVCYARPRNGATGNSATVNVNVITVQSTSYSQSPGGTVTLAASIDGPAIESLVWFRNNVQLPIDGTKYQNGNILTPSLTITSLSTGDSGSYYFTITRNGRPYTSSQISLRVQQGNAPQVTLPSRYTGIQGGFIILQCDVSPKDGLLYVNWTLPSGSTNIAIPQNKYAGGTVSTPSLYVYSLDSSSDTGFYTCRATNNAGTGTATTMLTVYKAPQAVRITPTSLSVNSGDPIRLTCLADGAPTQNFTWTKGFLTWTNVDFIDISSASSSDGGAYTCTVSNLAGSQSATVTVVVISVSDQQYRPKVGESVTLDCDVSGLTTFSVTWYKDGQAITSRGTKYFNGSSVEPSLTINPVSSSDSGTYVCNVAGGGVTKNSNDISVFVGNAPNVSIPESKYTGNVDGFVTIPCNVDPRTDLRSVNWYFNGVEISVASRPSKYQNGNINNPDLTILQLNSGDNGYYTCRATNPSGTGTSQQAQLTVFTVNVLGTRYTPTVGQSVTLFCTVALSSYTVKWYRNEQEITLPNSRYQNGIFPNPSLTINSVNPDDTGMYVCSISGGGFTKNGSSIEVSVQQQQIPPTPISFNPATVSVKSGERIQITANAGGSPTPVYRWRREDGFTYTGQTLLIPSATANDGGLYTVTASNSAGEINGTFFVNVEAQEVIATSTSYDASAGDSVIMGCTVRGVTNFVVTWYKDGQTLVRSDSRFLNGNAANPSLTITPVIASDTGKYICSATGLSNGISTNSSEISLSVGVIAPTTVTLSPATLTMLKGNPISVTCSADGTSPTYTWTKNGVTLSNSQSLYIESTTRFDDGEYICTATNSGGSKSASMDIDVRYPPVITTNIETVASNIGSTISLYCENDANPPATSYEWTYNGIPYILSSSILAVEVKDDNSFIEYQCKAISTLGTSEPHTFTLVEQGTGVVGASVGGGLSIAEILAIILGLLLLLLLLLLLIYCCFLRGGCAACCAACCPCCGKKKKDSKGRISPGLVYAGKPKATVHHIDIPRFYEVPNWKAKGSSTTSAVSRQDVHVSAGPHYYRSDEYEINAKMHIAANSEGGTIISMYDDRVHTPRDYHLPSLEYPAIERGEKKKKRKKKRKHRRREAGEGQEDMGEHLVNGAV